MSLWGNGEIIVSRTVRALANVVTPPSVRLFLSAGLLTAGQGGIARVARMTAKALIEQGANIELLSLLDKAPVEIAEQRANLLKSVRQRLGDVHDLEVIVKKSARAIYRDADAGGMPWGMKLGASRRWDLDEIDRWIANGCKPVR